MPHRIDRDDGAHDRSFAAGTKAQLKIAEYLSTQNAKPGVKMIKRLAEYFENQSWDRQILIFALLASAVLTAAGLGWSTLTSDEEAKTSTDNIDTYIPRGFVLLPIEVENADALDSILGIRGIVDLFLPSATKGSKAQLVARNVRLLRAPRNPSHFAVLVPESEASTTLAGGGPFWVVVKPVQSGGTEFVKHGPGNSHKAKGFTKRRIVFEGG